LLSITFLTITGLFIIGAPFYIAFAPRDPRYTFWNRTGSAAMDGKGQTQSLDKIIIPAGEDVIVGKLKLHFRGYSDNKIHIDLSLLELDPDSIYPRSISKKEAEKGFALGGRSFKLVSVKESRIVLRTVE